jgi:glutamate racemase
MAMMSKQSSNSNLQIDDRPWHIGVFDSGVGGLSILKELISFFPNAQFHYIADRAYVPYGSLSAEQVLARAVWCTNTLIQERQCHIVVVACNTATAVAIDGLRQQLASSGQVIPVVGVEPYLNVLNKEKQRIGDKENIWVLTTPLLANTERFQKLKQWRDGHSRIDVFPAAKLAALIEELFDCENQLPYPEIEIKDLYKRIELELLPLKKQNPELVILGCTHYPLLTPTISKILAADCVDPSRAVAAHTRNILAKANYADSCGSLLPAGQFAYLETKKNVEEQAWSLKSLASLSSWPK